MTTGGAGAGGAPPAGDERVPRQWIGIILVAVSLALLGVTSKQSGDDSSDYSVTALILVEGGGIALGLLLIFSHRIERVRAQHGVLLGAAAGLGFGISDVAIKAVTDDLEGGLVGLLSPWSALVVIAAVGSFFASCAEPAGGRWRGRECRHRSSDQVSTKAGELQSACWGRCRPSTKRPPARDAACALRNSAQHAAECKTNAKPHSNPAERRRTAATPNRLVNDGFAGIC